MILLAFSIPPEIPMDMMAKLAITAIRIQVLAPQLLAVELKVPTITFISCPIENIEPEIAMIVYLNTQPMTHV